MAVVYELIKVIGTKLFDIIWRFWQRIQAGVDRRRFRQFPVGYMYIGEGDGLRGVCVTRGGGNATRLCGGHIGHELGRGAQLLVAFR